MRTKCDPADAGYEADRNGYASMLTRRTSGMDLELVPTIGLLPRSVL